ncbi:MAG: DUF3833 domain-containing protein [Betaproteobacteria bacterium]|nr:DUF3833 domain-containing protein [Betaproteobacteria bacterium]MDH5219793.1 DUF3833 domain-containing protein [Betaproteobacteria bacterium]MDH5351266.1 DUF3833 domain-containing protein [Betaproteobacteria bacterium]
MKLWLPAALALLAGCSTLGPDAYRDQRPRFDLFEYFDGTVDAWGQFEDRSGKVVKRFVVLIRGTVRDGRLTLEEDFKYSDGTEERRVWTITRAGEGRYRGTAADVVGEAEGRSAGNALNWRYTLALVVDGRTWHVNFDDWMFLHEGGVLLNRAQMSKFGLRLGEVFIAFRRRA